MKLSIWCQQNVVYNLMDHPIIMVPKFRLHCHSMLKPCPTDCGTSTPTAATCKSPCTPSPPSSPTRPPTWSATSDRCWRTQSPTPGKCSTVPSFISICVSGLQFAAVDEQSEKCTISSQFAFQSSILRCSKWVSNGEWQSSSFEPQCTFKFAN